MAMQRRHGALRHTIVAAMMMAAALSVTSHAMAAPAAAQPVTLDTLFARVQQCQFGNFYYAPWDTATPIHPYFSQRALKPYREEEGLYYFKVQDTLFGLPVVTLFVPGTWDYHGVVFDVPLATARQVMRQRFGRTFAESRRSRDGEAPMLVAYKDNPTRQSVLACEERPYREK
jgi:hypothetical protein